MDLHLPSTTSDRPYSSEVFRITHPFHPLYGQTFELVQVRSNWGTTHVYYVNAEEQLQSLPISWTSLAAPDPFVRPYTNIRVSSDLKMHKYRRFENAVFSS
jgi:hypothetical protein